MNEGVHPLKKENTPSDRYMAIVTPIADNLPSAPVADIMRVFITSTGEHAVVATRPYYTKLINMHSHLMYKQTNNYCKCAR